MNLERTQNRPARSLRKLAWIGLVLAGVMVALAGIGRLAQAEAPSSQGQASAFAVPLSAHPNAVPLQAWSVTEDFEGANVLSFWQLTGTPNGPRWNLVTNGVGYGKSFSGQQAMWFGDPATGQYGGNCFFQPELNCPRYAGELTYVGPPIAIPSTFSITLMTFQSWELTEKSFPFGCTEADSGTPYCEADVRQVWISSTTDSNWQLKWHTNQGANQAPIIERQWRGASIDLSAYKGKSIRIRFRFDTNESISHLNPGSDDAANKPAGWFVDDVRLFAFTPSSFVYLPIVRK